MEQSPIKLNCSLVNSNLLVSIIPPVGTKRTPCDLCCVVDTSGSMGSDATLKNTETEANGLSILDIVKHAVRTVIETLEENDRLSIVEFNSNTKVCLPLTTMNANGKYKAKTALNALEADFNTNLWGGIENGLNVLKAGVGNGNNSVLLILTDGEPTVLPSLSHLDMLKNYQETHGSFCSIHSFGFGYELDSELLNELSQEGCGTYSFIPDCSLVGTVFVNTLSNILCTAGNDLELSIDCINDTIITECIGDNTCKINGNKVSLSLGSIYFDQERNLIFKVQAKDINILNSKEPYVNITLNLNTPSSEKLTLEYSGIDRVEGDELFEVNRLRLELVNYLHQILIFAKSNQYQDANKVIDDYINLVKSSNFSSNELIADYLQDAEGQIRESVSKEEWFMKWGIHYLPSLLNAHLHQQCNNFKDPGIQHYGGQLFNQIRDKLDELFVKLPPPTPTGFAAQMLQHEQRQQRAAQINMADYHYQGGG